MYTGIPFPDLDPVIFTLALGPVQFSLRWYALAYLFGIIFSWLLLRRMSVYSKSVFTPMKVDDFILWGTAGIIFGARLGYVIFYNLIYYLEKPWEILFVWQGGMSFHGGLLGVMIATLLFCKKKQVSLLMVADMICAVAPIGLFLGRLANFVNGELFGRVTTAVPWAIIFPAGGDMPRHPSQLYEACWEGLALFTILNLVWWCSQKYRERYGFTTGLFFCLYGAGRLILELFREPDAHLGFFAGYLTMGQILCMPMIALGAWLIWHSSPKRQLKQITKGKADA